VWVFRSREETNGSERHIYVCQRCEDREVRVFG
jgi:hypothetical protein